MAENSGSQKARKRVSSRYTEGEQEAPSAAWRGFFLDKLSETSNVTEAAKFAKIDPSRAYKMRREDAEFARKWRTALVEGYDYLELETLRRLRHGTGPDDPKFDIGSALRLLALHKESVAKERAKVEHSDEAQVLASLNKRLDFLRRNEGELKKALSQKVLPLLPETVREK